VNTYEPAQYPMFYFIGVTTGSSSIMKVFPKWSEALGIEAGIKGIDFPPNDSPEKFREVVRFIKNDPKSLGALVTTHKINLFKSCRDLFDKIDPYTEILDEVSSISKSGRTLIGHAKDPITSGLSLEAIVDDEYWQRSGGQLLLLGAGGSSLSLTLYLHEKALKGGDVPSKIIVNNRSTKRLEEMQAIHKKIDMQIPVSYHLTPDPWDNDKIVGTLTTGSMVVNATGLGKDRPGSPLTDAVVFPENGIAWDFNYRGDLVFLDQANDQKAGQNLTIENGWVYFIYGWTRVIAEVFHIDIPTSGPELDRLSRIAGDAN